MSTELVPRRTEIPPAATVLRTPPALIAAKGDSAKKAFRGFFLAKYPNPNTRDAYIRDVAQFLFWLEERGVPDLDYVEPAMVGLYVSELEATHKIRTVKRKLSAIRMCFDHLTGEGILPTNPALHARGPRLVAPKGVTPVLDDDQVLDLFESIDTSTIVGLRDRALIGVMLFSWARVSAVTHLEVKDFESTGRQTRLFLGEKGGRESRVRLHHQAEEFLDAYLKQARIGAEPGAVRLIDQPDTPLFRAVNRARNLTDRPLHRSDVLAMVKRRAKKANLPWRSVCNHSFRATGITNYMTNGGKLDAAQEQAGHADPRTTGLYDRSADKMTKAEIERMRFERES